MGRAALGVNGIRLDEGDQVAGAALVDPQADLLIMTTQGYGKRTPLAEFPLQGRYGQGVRCIGGQETTRGKVAAARTVGAADEVTLISTEGMALRTPVENIPQMGRAARGARVMDLKDDDQVASAAVLTKQ